MIHVLENAKSMPQKSKLFEVITIKSPKSYQTPGVWMGPQIVNLPEFYLESAKNQDNILYRAGDFESVSIRQGIIGAMSGPDLWTCFSACGSFLWMPLVKFWCFRLALCYPFFSTLKTLIEISWCNSMNCSPRIVRNRKHVPQPQAGQRIFRSPPTGPILGKILTSAQTSNVS